MNQREQTLPVARCSWWSRYDAHQPHEWVSGWHGTQWCPGTAVKKASS